MDSQSKPQSALTHVAIHVRDIPKTVAFYEKYTHLKKIHERLDAESTGTRSVWLSNPADLTSAASKFVIVLVEGDIPKNLLGGVEPLYGMLKPISHFGFSMESRAAVDRIAEMAKADGNLVFGPRYLNPEIGYICIIKDPDGNQLEFSHEQVLG